LPEASIVSCSDVSKTYTTATGSVEALRAVDLTVDVGTIAALVGRSGCGKSTLLRLLAGLDGPDSGRIEVASTDITRLRGRALRSYRRDEATYLAQRAAANLIPHLTIREQLGTRNTETAQRIGLGDRLDARAEQLSGGEQARAALAVGLARATPIVILDEPTAELDRSAAALVIELLKRAAADGRTIVLATHDPDLLELATIQVELTPQENASARAPRRRTRGTEPALTVRGLTKTYAGTPAVDDAYLDLRRGELGVLLGRSGSGKSTLLMAIGRWLTPDTGSVVISGIAPGAVPPWRDVSHLPQRFALLPELSIRENVELPLRLAHSRDDRSVTRLLEQLALSELRDRTPNEISIGQQQRAALARALVQHPTVLIADEPTSHQDTASAELIWEALSTAARNGTACLVATHDETLGTRADRVWQITDGRISTTSDSS